MSGPDPNEGGASRPSPSRLSPSRLSLRDRWRRLRTRLLSDPVFQARAIANPLTRPFALRGTRRSFDLVSGFVYSQTLSAVVALGLLDDLRAGPQPLSKIANDAKLTVARAERLMKAAAALGIMERCDDGRWGLGGDGAALAGNPGALAMIAHHHHLYRDLSDPVALLRDEVPETALANFWRYAHEADGSAIARADAEAYSQLMATSQMLLADEVLTAYPMARHRHILDVGGGDGSFISAVAAHQREANLTLFDLPGVAEIASQRMAERGLEGRVQVVGGDFTADPLPVGPDLITLIRILHDHDDDKALVLLKACRAALADGGALLIAEPMSGTPGGARIADAYFGFYLLAMGSGRARSIEEISDLLDQAGLRIVTPVTTRNPLMARVLVARVRA